jgi:putative transposase
VTYSPEQRRRILEAVQGLKEQGLRTSAALKQIGVGRSTYYSWLSSKKSIPRPASVQRLTESESTAIIAYKQQQPHLSHRKISGYLRTENIWVSATSCYRVLKNIGWVSEADHLREAPWKQPHYEPFAPNQIWGEDWTGLVIAGLRYYLLTIIDYFSRYIVAWGIVKTVTHQQVRPLLVLAYLSQNIDTSRDKPLLRVDRGSPNMAKNTRRLIAELEMLLSPSRSHRPTDNSRQERWYRTVKQEEIYCCPEYPCEATARHSVASYIHEYNEQRPHQALWNFTPGYVHRCGNKSFILNQYRQRVHYAIEQRLDFNRSQQKIILPSAQTNTF